MPTVLVASRYFPPLSSAGASIRLVKLIKYAAAEGWRFTILTQDPARPVIAEKALSEFLLTEIPAETPVLRVASPTSGPGGAARLLCWLAGDSSLPWGAAVVRRAWRLFHRDRPDLIFVNTPPFTNAAIGLLLSALLRVPFVLDM